MASPERRLYEKPVLIRHQSGLQNKFGRAPGLRVMEELDGIPLASLAERFGSPLYLISENAIRRKVQQVHDLRHPRLRDLTEPGELGEIRDDALPEEPVVLDRQGQ